jgi:hypothetical protein
MDDGTSATLTLCKQSDAQAIAQALTCQFECIRRLLCKKSYLGCAQGS